MKTLVIIPAYNEAENIVRVVDRLEKSCPGLDYVIINDGSKDNTLEICKEHGYQIIDLPINLGLAGAFQTGMKYAFKNNYDAAVQFDADGQHLPEYIYPMLKELCRGNHIVIGSRFVTQKKPFTPRMAGSLLISLAILLTTRKRIKDPTSGLRMYNREMIEEFALQINHPPEPDTISYLIGRGASVKEVQVVMEERIAGESYLNFSRSIAYMLRQGISIMIVQHFRGGKRFKECEENEEMLACL